MSTKQINFRAAKRCADQLSALAKMTGQTTTQILHLAIDRYYRDTWREQFHDDDLPPKTQR